MKDEEIIFKEGKLYNTKIVDILHKTLEFNEKFLELMNNELTKLKTEQENLTKKESNGRSDI